MEQKVYKYKEYEFKEKKKNLEFRKNSLKLTKQLFAELFDKKTNKMDEDLFVLYLHEENNLKEIFTTFLDGDINVINIDLNNDCSDDEYYSLIQLASEVLTNFFSSIAKDRKK